MENQVYKWFVRKGNVIVQKNVHCISLQLDYENGDYCLLAPTDADEIIEILTNISKQIWEDPNYVKKPYTKRLYQSNENEYYWDIETSQLLLKHNNKEDAIEIKYQGSSSFNLEINHTVEVIQILERLNK